jgi:hypothetical protein
MNLGAEDLQPGKSILGPKSGALAEIDFWW